MSLAARSRTLSSVPSAVHVSGVRVAHVHAPERSVRVNRSAQPSAGPIDWGRVTRDAGFKSRLGRGKSGLIYQIKQSTEWRVTVSVSRRREIVVGSARMQDHALALAVMWEQAVLSGHVDMG